jgi:hypothetical protein
VTIVDAVLDPKLFHRWFTPVATWAAWLVFLAAVFALPLTPDQLIVFQRHSARSAPPPKPVREAWLVVGRRGGKSRIAALVAVYLACFRDYRLILTAGERGIVMVVAADRRQARVVLRYIAGLINGVPMLKAMVERTTAEAIHLTNGISLEVHTANFRAVRGYTIVAAICDEIAFWPSEESATPDVEILNAIRPAMSTVPDALLLCISSPYARRGALWEAYRRSYGQEDDRVLVWQSDTLSMNPTVDARVIQDAYDQDEAAASAEYGGQFRRDVESFIPKEAVEAVVVIGRQALACISGVLYVAFVDPSGGSQDAMTLAIAHWERGRVVIDVLLERRAPFDPQSVVREFVTVLREYGITRVVGDRYAGEWVRSPFREHGVSYDLAELTRSELYQAALPLIMAQRLELPDHARLIAQLASLERRTSRAGRDTIGHPPGGHDDLANAVAGAAVLAEQRRKRMFSEFSNGPTGPALAPPGLWRCPKGCGHERLLLAPEVVTCPTCQPGWTLQDLLHRGIQL